MYPRNNIYSRPRTLISSRPHNSQEWSQTQDSQDWVESQDMRVPAAPQIRQIIRNNNQVVPSSQPLSHNQGGVCPPVEVSNTEDAREIVARDLRFGLHMILNLIKELPDKLKQDLNEVVQSQSSQQDEVKTHLQNTKEHLESLFANIEEKLGKLLENTDNSQTLQTTLSQNEERVHNLQKKLEELEEGSNKEQKEWFVDQLQGIRKELRKQLKKCQEGIQNISVEKYLGSFSEVIKDELHYVEDTLQEKFLDMLKDNKIQMDMVQRNVEDQLNDLKTLISNKMDEHYNKIKEALPEVVAKHVKCLERCNSRPSPLSDTSNRFISPLTRNTTQGYLKEHFYKSSPIATVKPLVKREAETARHFLRNTNHNLIPSSFEYQRLSVAENVRKPSQTPQLKVIPYKSPIAKNVRKAVWRPQSEVIPIKRVCMPEVQNQKLENYQNINKNTCSKLVFDIKNDKLEKLLNHDTQQFNIKISSGKTHATDKKFDMSNNSSDSEDGLSIYVLSADEEDPVLLDISTPPTENHCNKLPALKNVSNSNNACNINSVHPLHKSRTQEQIQKNTDSFNKLFKTCNEKKGEHTEVVEPVSPKPSMNRKVKRFITKKNRKISLS